MTFMIVGQWIFLFLKIDKMFDMEYECDEPSLFTSINKNTNKIFQLQLSIKEQH